ncbi:IucA/IucC family protein [Paenibacillus sp. V4I5]|uniref:IucA/IucC family protein n=1 Tax=Paenibacillus sp. V4I5 TaxID=3042306 RepID=UPI00278E7777|nr:IucA/IucC family protein [Paenibacillus sp. V4I5]MDQ0916524.1 siderophore synthetase component [Paenibacillus sp. V4I5]
MSIFMIEKKHKELWEQWDQIIRSQAYIDVRRRIFRQLIESLIYEGIVQPDMQHLESGFVAFTINGTGNDGSIVKYMCQGKRKVSFERIRLNAQPVQRVTSQHEHEAVSLATFLVEIFQNTDVDTGRLSQFIDEIQQTLLKDTLAHYYRSPQTLEGKERSYDLLESNLIDGHPYHPCYKSRIGFDLTDHMAYGPEFKPSIRLVWVAVAKERINCLVTSRKEYAAFIKQQLGDSLYGEFQTNLRNRGKNPDQYTYLPVHPWQWENVISTEFNQHCWEDEVIWLGEGQEDYRPQQSIRTLANASLPTKPYVKLPLSITNTSTGRILAAHTILNAPIISDWLSQLLDQDLFLKEKCSLILLKEIAGAAYRSADVSELLQSKVYGVLGTIWRESIHTYLKPKEEAVPFNAVTHVEVNGRPFIDRWVKEHGIERWMERYIEVSVVPLIHMLYAHGIALESHAQNMILVHENGFPTRLALKDFHDGIRFSREHLADPQQYPALTPVPSHHPKINRNSFIETDRPDVVRDFVHDAFFFINLAEAALFMEEHYQVPETVFWSKVAHTIRQYQEQHPQLQQRFELFDLFAETIQVEQLTKRRLFGDSEFRVHDVQNPLNTFGTLPKRRDFELRSKIPILGVNDGKSS